jgi:hypothetical protein
MVPAVPHAVPPRYEADGYFAAGDPPWRRRLSEDDDDDALAGGALSLSQDGRPGRRGARRYADAHDAFVHAKGAPLPETEPRTFPCRAA